MTSNALGKIVSRGYWKVILRPLLFKSNRISTLLECDQLITNSRVMGGWDYPHCEKIQSGMDYVWSEIDWEEHKEMWRFYQSGQFVHYSACIEDWWRESKLSDRAMKAYVNGEALDIVYALFRITQAYEFAARLAARGVFDDCADIHIGLHGALNRRLAAVNRNWALWEHRSSMTDLEFNSQFLAKDLVDNKNRLALENTLWVLERFDWRDVRKPDTVANLSKEQDKLLKTL